ncbi:MAG: hypothetical protein GXP02_07230, partial [Alphaproteobacteria bacterium]|nr:hypothetical protein [Alphaproteobacteria bacterium]
LSAVLDIAARSLKDVGEKTDTGIWLETIALMVTAAVPHYQMQTLPEITPDVAGAIKNYRPLYVSSKAGFVKSPIYDRAKLGRDNVIEGPALTESDMTTILVPDGWKMTVDKFNNAVLEKVKND